MWLLTTLITVLIVVVVLAIAFDVIDIPRFKNHLKLSKQERRDRKHGTRIVFQREYGSHGRWTKETFKDGYWIWEDNNHWYPAILNDDNTISCGCFYGTLAEFHQRISRKDRPQEAIDYYTAKYKEYEDAINLRTQPKSVEQGLQLTDDLSVGLARDL